jgi:hypothetical protein
MRQGLFGALGLVLACGHVDSPPSKPAPAVATPSDAPLRVGERIGSYVLDRKDDSGTVRIPQAKLTLLDFFGTFCSNSRFWFRTSQTLHDRYHASGLLVVGVSNYDEAKDEDIVGFARESGASFPIVRGDQHGFSRAIRPPNWQAIVIVDSSGVVRHVHHGTRPGDDTALTSEVERLLSATP